MLKIEQVLKDVYKFYKSSSKRKKGLEEIALLQREPLTDFFNTITTEVANGEAELEKRPLLRLQCWNAMRWLGRSQCLNSLCRAYEYILAHLSHFAQSKGEKQEKKLLAIDLYDKLTSYDIFMFIFLQRPGSNYGENLKAITIQGHPNSRCWTSDLELMHQIEDKLFRNITNPHTFA